MKNKSEERASAGWAEYDAWHFNGFINFFSYSIQIVSIIVIDHIGHFIFLPGRKFLNVIAIGRFACNWSNAGRVKSYWYRFMKVATAEDTWFAFKVPGIQGDVGNRPTVLVGGNFRFVKRTVRSYVFIDHQFDQPWAIALEKDAEPVMIQVNLFEFSEHLADAVFEFFGRVCFGATFSLPANLPMRKKACATDKKWFISVPGDQIRNRRDKPFWLKNSGQGRFSAPC